MKMDDKFTFVSTHANIVALGSVTCLTKPTWECGKS